jgi:glycerol dehydrogenase-like iron-containing ADH family enzyme
MHLADPARPPARTVVVPLGIVTTSASLCAITSFVGLVLPVVRARISRQRP